MADSDPDAARVLELVEEFLGRYRRGQRPSVKEFIDRHPDLAGPIRELLPAMAILENVALADESSSGDHGRGPASDRQPAPEQLGDFRILREVGRGGMGVVYEAEQVSLGRQVALKVLPERTLRDPSHRRRFEREARVAGRLHHTNIVPVFGVGEHEGTPYYVMQFIAGLGLDAVLDELRRLRGDPGPGPGGESTRGTAAESVARSLWTGRFEAPGSGVATESAIALPPRSTDPDAIATATAAPTTPGDDRVRESVSPSTSSATLLGQGSGVDPGADRTRRPTYWQGVARIGVQVAEALAHAHAQGVLHRDIKPSNLLLDAQGTVWVADFGLAKLDDRQDLTRTGDILGTLRYMPPEAFEGRHDARGDIYSLGLTLFELLAFRPAFDEPDRGRLIRRVTAGDPPRLGRLNPGVPRDLQTIVHKAIDRDPAHRYPTAADLADDLKRFLADRPVRARRASGSERLLRWARRNPAVAGLAASLAAALLLISAGSLIVAATFRDQVRVQRRLIEGKQAEFERANRAARDFAAAEVKARDAKEWGDRLFFLSNMRLAEKIWEDEEGTGPAVANMLDEHVPQAPGAVDLREFTWRYHWSRLHRGTATFDDPEKAVAGAFDADGLLVTLDVAEVVRRREPATGRVVAERDFGQGRALGCTELSADGSILARGEVLGSTLRLCDAHDGRELRAIEGPSPIRDVTFSPDGRQVVSLWFDRMARVHDVATGDLRGSFQAQRDIFHLLAISPDGATLALANHPARGRVTLVDLGSGSRSVPQPEPGSTSISALVASPDGRRFASGGFGGEVVVWDAGAEPPACRTIGGLSSQALRLAFSGDGRRLAAGGIDGTIGTWDVAEGRPIDRRLGHLNSISMLAFDRDANRLTSGDTDGRVKVWDLGTTPGRRTLAGEIQWSFLAFSGDGRVLVRGGPDVLTCDGRTWAELDRIGPLPMDYGSTLTAKFTCVDPGADGSRMAAGDADSRVFVWEGRDGRAPRIFDGVEAGAYGPSSDPDAAIQSSSRRMVCSVALSADGSWLAAGFGSRNEYSGSYPQFVKVWDLRGGVAVAMLPVVNAVVKLDFPPGEGRLLAVCRDGTIRTWLTGDWSPSPPIQATERGLGVAALSPDRATLAVGRIDGWILLLERATGRTLHRVRGHSSFVYGLAFSPDGKTLASTSSNERGLALWDVATLRELSRLPMPASLGDVAFAPDGRSLAVSTKAETFVLEAMPLDRIDATSAEEARRRAPVEPTSAPAPTTIAPIPSDRLEALAGEYRVAPALVLTIRRRGDGLVAMLPQSEPLGLLPASGSEFACPEIGARFRFEADGSGRADRLVVEQDGRTLEASRIGPSVGSKVTPP